MKPKDIKYKSVTQVAFIDISYFTRKLRKLKFNVPDSPDCELWFYTAQDIFTSENKELNRRLGLHKINKINNKTNFKK